MDSSRIRKPAHLPILDATAMGPNCQLSWSGVDYGQCPMTECLLDVTEYAFELTLFSVQTSLMRNRMDDQSLLSIDISPKVKHLQSISMYTLFNIARRFTVLLVQSNMSLIK